MLRNKSLHFICKDVSVKIENAATAFTGALQSGQVLKVPIAHADGNYYTDPVTLAAMQANAQIVLRYCTPDGTVTTEANPNGSLDNIAGIVNAEGNVLGMMPHPERCAETVLGNEDGKLIFLSMWSPEGIRATEWWGRVRAWPTSRCFAVPFRSQPGGSIRNAFRHGQLDRGASVVQLAILAHSLGPYALAVSL